MPTVAELDVHVDADDDASATLLALDALIKSLDNDDVDIDIDANAEDVNRQIAILQARLRRLGQEDPDIDIDVNAGDASAELAALRAELAALRDETIRVRINDRDLRRARTSMNDFRNSATQASRSTNAVLAAVLGLGAALIPIGAVAVGGVMALVGAFAVAGIGAALFGGVAVTAFQGVRKNLKLLEGAQEDYNKALNDEERDEALAKTKAIMDSMDPATRAMTVAVLDFKKAWVDFSMQFQPQVFQIATEGLAGLTALFPSLKPIVNGAAGAFLSLEKAAFRALQGPFWQDWFSMMGSNVGPIMNQLGRSIGNLIKGFAAIIQAFMPMTRDFSGGMLEMSRSFATWAEGLKDNKGFQDFVDYIEEQTPSVLKLIGALTLAFIAIGKAAAPLGEILVSMVTGLALAITAFQEAHPRAATITLAFIAMLAVAVKLLGPILQIGRLFMVLAAAFGMLATPLAAVAGFFGILTSTLLIIIGVIAAVVLGIIYAYTHFEAFKTLVDGLASAIATFATMAYTAIVGWLGQALAWLQTTFGPAIAIVIDFIRQQFDRVTAWATENAPMFQQAWDNIVLTLGIIWQTITTMFTTYLAVITQIWTAVWPVLGEVLKGAWEIIKGIVSGALSIIMGIITLWGAVLSGNWSEIWQGILLILQGVWQIIWGFLKGAYIILKAITDVGLDAIKAAMRFAWNLILDGVRAAWNTILAVIRAAWNGITTVVSTAARLVMAGLRAAWNTITSLTRTAWNVITTVIRTAARLIMDGLRAAWNTVTTLTRTAWNSVRTAVRDAWNNLTSSVRTGISTLLSLLRGFGTNAVGIVTGLAGRFLRAGASMMANLASGIRSGIGNAVGAVKDAVGQLTDLLPGSPAKVGPLSGSGYAMIRGQHLAEDLAAGMASRAGLVGMVARDIADLMSLGTDSPAAFNAITSGVNTGGSSRNATVTIAPGAVVVTVGEGQSLADAKQAFGGAGDEFADKLLTSLRRM